MRMCSFQELLVTCITCHSTPCNVLRRSKRRLREAQQAPWLLLMFSLPTKQASGRVEVWRKLKKYGALPLKSSGYLLPNKPETQERFEWLATAIRKYKGDASVVQVQAMDDLPSEKLVQLFI